MSMGRVIMMTSVGRGGVWGKGERKRKEEEKRIIVKYGTLQINRNVTNYMNWKGGMDR